MATNITEPPEKGSRNGKMGLRLRRLWSRRATPESSSVGLERPEAASVVVVEEETKKKQAVVAVVNGRESAYPAGSTDEPKDSHEDGGVDRAEDKKEKEKEDEDEDDASDDVGSDAGIDTGNDNGDDSYSTKGREASGPLPNFWEKAWNSDEVGKQRRSLLQEHLAKPAGSGKKHVTAAAPRTNPPKRVLEGVIKNTQDKVAIYTARWGSGDDNKTNLGAARSVLVSALTVKEVLDSILQFDPTWYGSAAWAIVSFSLTLVQNDKELMDLTFEACEYLADLMARYARIETHYRNSKAKRDKPLEDALVSVYVAILVYAAEVEASRVAKVWTRIRKSIISLTGQPLEDLKEEINNQKAKLEEWQKVVDRERAEEAATKLRSIEDDTDELLKRVDELAKEQAKTLHGIKTEELRELWKWLREMEGESQSKIRKSMDDEIALWKSSGDDQWKPWNTTKNKARSRKRKENVRFEESDDGDGKKSTKTDEDGSEDDDDDDHVPEKAAEDKGQGDKFGDWLFRTREYIDWIKYPQGLLWLHGNAGCGKSAQCAAIIKNLKETFRKHPKTKVFASWHFRVDVDDTKKINLMLVSLLRQLASKCEGFRDKKSHSTFRGYQDDGELPTDTKELLACLRRFIISIDKDVFLVLEGVDQVPERQGTRDNDRKLLNIIKSLALKGYPNLHILVVSRNERDIRLYFEENMKEMLVSVDVEEGLREALTTLIDRKLKGRDMMARLKEDQDLKVKIEERLKRHEQFSNFLWASSVLRQVLQCRDAKEIKQALGKIPDNINTRYQTALSKVVDKDKDRMKRILLWLRWAERPLSQAELVAATDLGSPAAVTEICSRVLIETGKEHIEVGGRWRTIEVFRFTHFSVREYIDVVAKELEAPNKSSNIGRSVLLRPGEDAHLLLAQRCLAVLSACRFSQKTRTNATAKTRSDIDWDHDAGAISASDDASQHSGASHDIDANSASHEDTDSEEDRESSSSSSSSAVDGGCHERPARRYAAEFCLGHYAKIDREKLKGSTELSPKLDDLEREICSQMLGDASKMRFWLRIHDPDGRMNEMVPSPMYYAVKLKLEKISMRLISQVAQLPADAADRRVALLDQPGVEGTALQLAAHQGDSRILEELIKHKANVNSEGGPHGTALYASAARGDEDAVEKLLGAGAELDGEDHGDLGSPLHVAAFWGHDAIVKLFLEKDGSAVDQRAGPFGTALQAASAARRFSTIKLLLDMKADPNIVGGYLGTAAQAASTHDEGQLGLGDTLTEELRSRGAQFFEHAPLFWRVAYEKAICQGTSMGMGRYPSALDWDEFYSGDYPTLLRKGSPTLQQVRIAELGGRQVLLASVISQWTLPMARLRDPFHPQLVSRVPFYDQLDAIRQVVPQHKLDIQHLCHRDFMYKACFWAGINCILGNLPSLVEDCLEHVYAWLRRYGHGRRGEDASRSPVLAFRWAFEDFEDNPFYRDQYREDDPRTQSFNRRRRREKWRLWRIVWRDGAQSQPNTQDMTSFTNRSDLVAMELKQARQRRQRQQRQQQLEDTLQPPPSVAKRDILESAACARIWYCRYLRY